MSALVYLVQIVIVERPLFGEEFLIGDMLWLDVSGFVIFEAALIVGLDRVDCWED